jgi:hypothetical protein
MFLAERSKEQAGYPIPPFLALFRISGNVPRNSRNNAKSMFLSFPALFRSVPLFRGDSVKRYHGLIFFLRYILGINIRLKTAMNLYQTYEASTLHKEVGEWL